MTDSPERPPKTPNSAVSGYHYTPKPGEYFARSALWRLTLDVNRLAQSKVALAQHAEGRKLMESRTFKLRHDNIMKSLDDVASYVGDDEHANIIARTQKEIDDLFQFMSDVLVPKAPGAAAQS